VLLSQTVFVFDNWTPKNSKWWVFKIKIEDHVVCVQWAIQCSLISRRLIMPDFFQIQNGRRRKLAWLRQSTDRLCTFFWPQNSIRWNWCLFQNGGFLKIQNGGRRMWPQMIQSHIGFSCKNWKWRNFYSFQMADFLSDGSRACVPEWCCPRSSLFSRSSQSRLDEAWSAHLHQNMLQKTKNNRKGQLVWFDLHVHRRTLIKKKIKFSSYIRKFRRDRL
jgi:hypothetical protein